MISIFTPQKDGGETRYEKAQGAFNEMYATFANAARFWRHMAYGAWVVAAITGSGLVAVSLQHKIVPYAVEFNDHGEAVRISRADEMAQPSALQIRAALRTWIIGARTVYLDRRAQESLVRTTTAMTMPNSAAYQTLANYLQENNPYLIAEKATVEVAVHSVHLVRESERTWLIEWTETIKEKSGRLLSTKAWQGTFTVVIVPPTDESQIYVNPIGMYVEQFSWGQRQ